MPKVPAQEVRALLVARKQLQARLDHIELGLRGILRGFGLKLGGVAKGRFEARGCEFVAGQARLGGLAEPMLRARAALHLEVLRIVWVDADCRRTMTVSGYPSRLPAVPCTSAAADAIHPDSRSASPGAYPRQPRSATRVGWREP
jgi:hypothetical protein